MAHSRYESIAAHTEGFRFQVSRNSKKTITSPEVAAKLLGALLQKTLRGWIKRIGIED